MFPLNKLEKGLNTPKMLNKPSFKDLLKCNKPRDTPRPMWANLKLLNMLQLHTLQLPTNLT